MNPDLDAMRSALAALKAEIETLDSAESLTDDETARFAAALDEYDTARADYDAAVTRAARIDAVRSASFEPANREAGFGAPQVMRRADPFADLDSLRHADDSRFDRDLASRAASAIEATASGIADAHVAEALRKVESIPGAARHVLLTSSPAYRSAFREWGRSGGNPAYSPEEAHAVRAALAVGTGSTGLFAIPALLDPSVILTGAVVANPVRQLARVVTGTAPEWNGVSAGAVTTYWTAESTAMTEGNPVLANPKVVAHKATAYLPGSYEVWEDSNLEADLVPAIAESFDNLEATAFISGTGTGQPFGVITAVSGTAGSLVTATTRGSFTKDSSADVFALFNAVGTRFKDTSALVANRSTLNTIRQMATGNGGLFWADLRQGIPDSLNGYPVHSTSAVTATATSGSHIAILGDFSRYVIYDRIGTSLEWITNVVNGDGLPIGQRAIVAHKRVGGNVTDVNAFRLLKA